MSAIIIPLPGAAAAPVQTCKLPPGRPPKNVTSIRRARWYRAVRQARIDEAGRLEGEARSYRAMVACMPEYMSVAQEKAALLEAEARALRGASR
jgi:hypothetical protein